MSAAHSNVHIEHLKKHIFEVFGKQLTGTDIEFLYSCIDIAYVRGQQNGLEDARKIMAVRPVSPSGS